MDRLMTRALRRRTAAALAVAIGATLAIATPAEATIVFRTTDAGEDEDQFEYCGLDVDYHVEWHTEIKVREGKNRAESAFFLQERFSAVETITNPANGKYFTVSHRGVFQELKATRVEGSVFEFVAHEVGQPFVVRDMDGNVLLRDRGNITFTVLFDTEGDDQIGGIFLGLLDLRIAGPHPGFFIEPGDECPAVLELIG